MATRSIIFHILLVPFVISALTISGSVGQCPGAKSIVQRWGPTLTQG